MRIRSIGMTRSVSSSPVTPPERSPERMSSARSESFSVEWTYSPPPARATSASVDSSRALVAIREKYEYIIIDCPPSLGLLTVNVLTAADSLLIPVQCEYYALEGLGQLLGTVKLVQSTLNPDLAIEGVLLTMFDKRLNLASQVVDETVNYFGDKVYETIIPRNVRLSESPSFGKPILLYDIQSKGAESYLQLAKEVIASA